jgi:hypothetical protein
VKETSPYSQASFRTDIRFVPSLGAYKVFCRTMSPGFAVPTPRYFIVRLSPSSISPIVGLKSNRQLRLWVMLSVAAESKCQSQSTLSSDLTEARRLLQIFARIGLCFLSFSDSFSVVFSVDALKPSGASSGCLNQHLSSVWPGFLQLLHLALLFLDF